VAAVFIFRDLCALAADFRSFLAASQAASVTFHLSPPGGMGQAADRPRGLVQIVKEPVLNMAKDRGNNKRWIWV